MRVEKDKNLSPWMVLFRRASIRRDRLLGAELKFGKIGDSLE
jgi:hypothetical protein